MATPDYITTEEVRVPVEGDTSNITIPKGTFVRPIDYRWVPKHILESKSGISYWKQTDQFCYSKYGIHPIPKKVIRRI